MKTPLNKKLENVKWGEYELGELFEVLTSEKRFDANKVRVLESGEHPYVVRLGSNNGHKGFIDEDKSYLNEGNTISFGQDTATMYYQRKPYFTGDKIKILKAKTDRFSMKNAQFFISTMTEAFSTFSWGSSSFSVDTIKSQKLSLPISESGEIDFDFMESILADVEADKITALESYLSASGLKDCTLTKEEKIALGDLEQATWGIFKIEDVLVWQQKIAELNPLDLDSLSISAEKKYPFYGQATANNGIIEYRHLNHDVLNNKLGKSTILIHSNNQNTVYLDTPFYLKDGHGATSVLQSEKVNELNAHFLISAIKKVITKKFAYNNKATKIALKSTEISLPIKADNTPDYDFMELIISATQKLVIKDVVQYADAKSR